MSSYEATTPIDPAPEETPVCRQCFTPHSPHRYYCSECGAAVGQYTEMIPFIDIPFEANCFGRLWERVWFQPDVPFTSRAFSLVMIVFGAPVMLLGLPFAIARMRKPKELA